MRKLRPDFLRDDSSAEVWYDLREDWSLIEASLAKQYGIRIRQEVGMPWTEFSTLVGGLMPDTPLGTVVGIRAEKDQETIKAFSPDQRRIHRDWHTRQALKKLDEPDKLDREMDNLGAMFKAMFGAKGVNECQA